MNKSVLNLFISIKNYNCHKITTFPPTIQRNMEIICLLCRFKHQNIDKCYFCRQADNQNAPPFSTLTNHPSAMKEQTYSFTYREYEISELSEPDKLLLEMAIDATRHSYAPYSEYNVGAALRLEGGEIIQGANQENASYPCGTCAERTAINYAQSSFPDAKVEVIAIAAHSHGRSEAISDTPPYPCGLCRQALAEVEHRQQAPIRVLLATAHNVLEISSATSLLPFAFKL